jgi:hypothetical protein
MSLFSLIISWRSVILLPQPQTFQMLLTTFIIFSLIEYTSPWDAGELKNILWLHSLITFILLCSNVIKGINRKKPVYVHSWCIAEHSNNIDGVMVRVHVWSVVGRINLKNRNCIYCLFSAKKVVQHWGVRIKTGRSRVRVMFPKGVSGHANLWIDPSIGVLPNLKSSSTCRTREKQASFNHIKASSSSRHYIAEIFPYLINNHLITIL